MSHMSPTSETIAIHNNLISHGFNLQLFQQFSYPVTQHMRLAVSFHANWLTILLLPTCLEETEPQATWPGSFLPSCLGMPLNRWHRWPVKPLLL